MGQRPPKDKDASSANVEDELAEDALESVSGGMSPANKMSVVHVDDDLLAVPMAPDVCKTPSPGGPVPIPYPVMVPTPTAKKK